jgi:hypothetical protein
MLVGYTIPISHRMMIRLSGSPRSHRIRGIAHSSPAISNFLERN